MALISFNISKTKLQEQSKKYTCFEKSKTDQGNIILYYNSTRKVISEIFCKNTDYTK